MSHIVLLETERLFLRRFTMADAPLLHALDSDPEVMRYISKGRPTPLDVIEQRVLPRWLSHYETYTHFGYWAAHERDSGAFTGWFHMRPDRFTPEELELGYRLMRRVWGRGYATEGGRALIERAFEAWGIDKISARTLTDNTSSRRVMEKCGLRFEEAFIYPEKMLPDWTEEERRAVKYGLSREVSLASRPAS